MCPDFLCSLRVPLTRCLATRFVSALTVLLPALRPPPRSGGAAARPPPQLPCTVLLVPLLLTLSAQQPVASPPHISDPSLLAPRLKAALPAQTEGDRRAIGDGSAADRAAAALDALRALAGELSIPHWAAVVVVDQSLREAVHAPATDLGVNPAAAPGAAPALAPDQALGGASRAADSGAQNDAAPGIPLAFPLGSATEMFTAVLAATLVDDGTLRWDESVRSLLPGFMLAEAQRGAECTLRDLLSHRTGVMRTDLAWLGNPPSPSIVAAFGRALPTVAFRSRFQPESTGYVPLGLALTNAALTTQRPVPEALATMESWEALLRTRLLDPLGMAHTALDHGGRAGGAAGAQGQLAPPLLEPMARRADGEERQLPVRPSFHAGSAVGLRSTLADLGRWLQLLVGRGRIGDRRLVSTERMEELWRPELSSQPVASPDIAGGAGMGFQVGAWRSNRVIRHQGGLEGLRVCLMIVPERSVGVLLIASAGPEALARRAEARLLPILLGDDAATAQSAPQREPEGAMAPLLGRYRSLVLGADLELRAVGGRLELAVSDGGSYDLLPPDTSGRRALVDVPDVFVTTLLGEDERARAILLEQSGMRFECRRVLAAPPQATPDPALRALTGIYLDPAGSRNLAVVVAPSGRLALELPRHAASAAESEQGLSEARRAAGRLPLLEFEPGAGADEWVLVGVPSASATFTRDASERVTGVSMRGVQGLQELHRIGELSLEAAGVLPDPAAVLRNHRRAIPAGGAPMAAWRQEGSVRMLHQGLEGRFERHASAAELSLAIDLGEYGSALIALGPRAATIDAYFDGPRALEPIEADRWRLAMDPRSPAHWLEDAAFRFAGVDGPSSAPAARFVLRTPAGAEAMLTIDLATLRARRLETELALGAAGSGPLVVTYEEWAEEPGSVLSRRQRWDSPVIGRVEWRIADVP
jgi:CubicO group peptidase (beta-lactamase class C family)